MTETKGTPGSDVAVALIAGLEAGAAFVDDGSFTLDSRKAREKLAAHRLAEPERYVLFLVEAAHLLPNCTGVTFTIDIQTTRAVFQGVELNRAELQGCFDALFIDVAGHDPESARRLRGRQRLALAINTALGLRDARVEMRSTIAGDVCVHVAFDAEARVQTQALPSTSSTSALVVEIHHAANWQAQQAVLREDACYATVPIQLDGARISGSVDLCAAIEIRDVAGRVVGQAGWCVDQARRELAMVALVANGVIVETYPDPDLPVGVLVLLEAGDLTRDISYSKLQRDEAFRQRLEAVTPSCAALSKPAPSLGPPFPWFIEASWGVVCVLLGLFTLATTFFIWEWTFVVVMMDALIFVFGLGLGLWGLALIAGARQYHRVRASGEGGLATIRSSTAKELTVAGSRNVSGTMWIERPGQDAYTVEFYTEVKAESEKLIEPGKRVYVRIDPKDHKHVVFDAGD